MCPALRPQLVETWGRAPEHEPSGQAPCGDAAPSVRLWERAAPACRQGSDKSCRESTFNRRAPASTHPAAAQGIHMGKRWAEKASRPLRMENSVALEREGKLGAH